MADQDFDARTRAFSKAIQGLLRPQVKALIAQGITAPALYRLIKQIYVEVAEQEFRLGDERPTDSRISMLTGVHRRDVRDFRDPDRSQRDEAEQKVTTIATVLGRWLADPETTDGDGRPLPLPRSAKDGPSFEALVQSVSRDIRPRTVLDELVRQNLVEIDPKDSRVHVRTDAFLGPGDADQKVYFFAENVGDHIAAAVDNLLTEEPRFMERAVFYNRLRAESVDEIEDLARDLGTDLLVRLNRLANERQAEDMTVPEGTERFRFGVFFYREDESGSTNGPGDSGPDESNAAEPKQDSDNETT
ncbi:MAG: DUF6502 family protein [Pseudomonadota bacterium]